MPDTPKPPGTPTVPSSAPSRRGPVLIDYGTTPGTAPGTWFSALRASTS